MPKTHQNWKAVVGLTGGMGSGKSTALEFFRKKGAFTLDADRIVHEALAKKDIQKNIQRAFGLGIFDKKGALNRKELARRIFVAPTKRKRLEKILHPVVRSEMARALNGKKGTVAICDVPLLYEKGLAKRFKWVIVVDARRSVREKRLTRKGFSLSDVRARFKTQWPMPRKIKRADFVVTNNGKRSEMKKQIDTIWTNILRRIHGISARA